MCNLPPSHLISYEMKASTFTGSYLHSPSLRSLPLHFCWHSTNHTHITRSVCCVCARYSEIEGKEWNTFPEAMIKSLKRQRNDLVANGGLVGTGSASQHRDTGPRFERLGPHSSCLACSSAQQISNVKVIYSIWASSLCHRRLQLTKPQFKGH